LIKRTINAKFEELSLPLVIQQDVSAVVPTIKGTPFLKYGQHAYYFFNFKMQRGLRVTLGHKEVILPGVKRFFKSASRASGRFPFIESLFRRYHNNFNFLEQIMLMTVPHAVTPLKNGCFLINLWSYFGYLEVDCRNRTVTYNMLDKDDDGQVLGSQQFYDAEKNERYYVTYSLRDSYKRATITESPVSCRISKQDRNIDAVSEVWSGDFVDYIHDIVVNKTRQYCVVPELGMLEDRNGGIIPSKVLVVDMKNKRSWVISKFSVAAHAQFDPDEPDIIYFSSHNFMFRHSNILKLLKNAIYDVEFKGPAAVHKYELTPEGPRKLAEFSSPDFFRLTNFHVFNHRGQKIIAAISSPNYIFIIDADNMKLVKKISVNHERTAKSFFKQIPSVVGTISPSIDGEKIFVQTNRSFQVVDVASGKADTVLNHYHNHTCANHMITSSDVEW